MAYLKRFEDKLLSLFLVNPSAGKTIPYMDGIRAIAVLLVVVFHAWVLSGAPPLTYPISGTPVAVNIAPIIGDGFIGVQLFFVLAGFLLSQHWLRADRMNRPRPKLGVYFRQRIARIVPAYYVCLFLLLLFFVPSLIPVAIVYSRIGLFILGAHLLFLQYIFPVSSSSYVIDGSLWTLTMEMIFYAVLPLIMVFFIRRRWIPTFLATVALSVGWLYLSKHSLGLLVSIVESHTPYAVVPEPSARYFLSQQFPTHLVSFAAGISLANVYVAFTSDAEKSRLFRTLTSMSAGHIYLATGIVILYVDFYHVLASITFGYYFYEVVSSVAFTLCIAGVLFGGRWLQAVFSILPLRFLGIIGYSIYLWHLPLIHVFNTFPNIAALPVAERFPTVLLLAGSAVLVLASFLYLAVEKPFMLLGRRSSYLRQAKAPVLEPVGTPVPMHIIDPSVYRFIPSQTPSTGDIEVAVKFGRTAPRRGSRGIFARLTLGKFLREMAHEWRHRMFAPVENEHSE